MSTPQLWGLLITSGLVPWAFAVRHIRATVPSGSDDDREEATASARTRLIPLFVQGDCHHGHCIEVPSRDLALAGRKPRQKINRHARRSCLRQCRDRRPPITGDAAALPPFADHAGILAEFGSERFPRFPEIDNRPDRSWLRHG